MPNKPWDRLLSVDRLIRRLSPNKDMTASGQEPQIRITLIRGFELFNTRHYHNYETWSDGYLVEAFGPDGTVLVKAEAEDLDDALELLRQRMIKAGIIEDQGSSAAETHKPPNV